MTPEPTTTAGAVVLTCLRRARAATLALRTERGWSASAHLVTDDGEHEVALTHEDLRPGALADLERAGLVSTAVWPVGPGKVLVTVALTAAGAWADDEAGRVLDGGGERLLDAAVLARHGGPVVLVAAATTPSGGACVLAEVVGQEEVHPGGCVAALLAASLVEVVVHAGHLALVATDAGIHETAFRARRRPAGDGWGEAAPLGVQEPAPATAPGHGRQGDTGEPEAPAGEGPDLEVEGQTGPDPDPEVEGEGGGHRWDDTGHWRDHDEEADEDPEPGHGHERATVPGPVASLMAMLPPRARHRVR